MLFASPPADYYLLRPEVVAFSRYQGVQYRGGLPCPFGLTSRTMSAIRFGQTMYRLRSPTKGVFTPSTASEGGEFLVGGFQREIVGLGSNPEEAYRDWLTRFHVEFQRLYAMQPFEMEEQGRKLWSLIEEWVDVEQYRASQPLIVLQEGEVCRARPFPEIVQWEDGTKEKVRLSQMPGEFATYKAGQPFEALVHRDSVSHRIIKVEYVRRLQARARKSKEESQHLWDSLPTTESLPDTDWD